MMNIEEAEKEAEEHLRYNIGNLPFICPSDENCVTETEDEFVFDLFYRKVFMANKHFERDEIKFSEKTKIGVISVDKETGEVTSTDTETLNERIKQFKKNVTPPEEEENE